MILVNDLRPGSTFGDKGNIYITLDVTRNKSARGQMIIKIKSKNLRTGTIGENSYSAGDKVEVVFLDKKEMLYLYDDGDNVVFMDNQTYDQMEVEKNKIEWELNFLTENQTCSITYFGSELIGIDFPQKVEMEITECAPAVRGDTVSKATKDAFLSTGFLVKVPLFIEQGDRVIIKTDKGTYDSRA